MNKTMKRSYQHVSIEERVEIYRLWKAGDSYRSIAKRLNRNVGTISREIKRNRTRMEKEYTPIKAQEISSIRSTKQRTKAPLKDIQIWLYVREKLRVGWSPEMIEGRIGKDHPGKSISYETIYRYIYGRGKKQKLYRYLIKARKKRMKKNGRRIKRNSKISDAISIDKRPYQVNKRFSYGHWESDNMLGKQTDKAVVSVSTERLTRLTILTKTGKTSNDKMTALTTRLGIYPKKFRKTVTMDNGAENTNHKTIKQTLDMNSYFCHPYHSWEKGTIENTIGRIRRYIPKGTSIDEIPAEYIQEIEHTLNNTPRKCLNFLTPYEKKLQVLTGKISRPGVALQL